MTDLADVALRRFRHEHLAGPGFARPEEAVAWLGAVQAQDHAGARWAIGQRVRGCTDADVERAFEDGRLLRTHVLRPTWHLVLPADLRWLLALTAPRVKAAMASYDRKLDLTPSVYRRSAAALEKALRGPPLTRGELALALERAGIAARGQRLAHLVMRAELDALLVSGPRRGKQHTYALFDARVPPSPPRPRDEAVAALAARYFRSHGPAQVHDFAWWSGLGVTEARAGVAAQGTRLVSEEVDGKTYWLDPAAPSPRVKRPAVRLLPNYDELVVAYRDHTATLDPALGRRLHALPGTLDRHLVTVDGRVVGGWWATAGKGEVRVGTRLLRRLGPAERAALLAEVDRYGRFLGLPATAGTAGR